MSASNQPRIWMSQSQAKIGDAIRVRAQIGHKMETGLRLDDDGKIKARDIVTHFEALFEGEKIFIVQLGPANARNPYVEFTFSAQKSGVLQLKWTGDNGFQMQAEKSLAVQ